MHGVYLVQMLSHWTLEVQIFFPIIFIGMAGTENSSQKEEKAEVKCWDLDGFNFAINGRSYTAVLIACTDRP